ncbi:MAG: hypothetical protein IMY86_01480 [Chloroflexi bacterium]|nr:hypothetical protein [Chloroflexota bacterium]
MSEEITEYIVRELGRHRKENNIIFAVAKRANLDWGQAKELVEEVKITQSARIARRQSPLLLVLGIGTMIGGVVLSVSVAFGTLSGVIIFLPALPIPYLGNAVLFLTGLAMIAGAAWGLGRLVLDVTGS